MIKYMLRAYLGEGLLPGDCLSRLNNAVYDQVPLEKFITAGLAIIDTTARDFISRRLLYFYVFRWPDRGPAEGGEPFGEQQLIEK